MAWVAVNEKGNEIISDAKLTKTKNGSLWITGGYYNLVVLPKGSIKKLIGRELSFNDKPVELVYC